MLRRLLELFGIMKRDENKIIDEIKLKVARNPQALREIDRKHLLNREVVNVAIRKDGYLYSILPKEMKNDIGIAKLAYNQTGEILPEFPKKISERLRDNSNRVAAIGKIKVGKEIEVTEEKNGEVIKSKYDENLNRVS